MTDPLSDNYIYTYDDKIHVTAAQLRACGLKIPDRVPDRAFVPRYSMRFDVGDAITDGDLCGINFQIYMSQPFRWIEANLHLKDDTTKKVPT